MKLRSSLATLALVVLTGIPVLAQGPLHKQVDFSIDSPFELKQANVVLPPGNYILYQLSNNDPSLFALYRGDMRHKPIAMIRTTRIDYSTRWPQHTKVLLDTDERSAQSYPVVEGWTIPGDDGFEVISTVTRRHGMPSYIR